MDLSQRDSILIMIEFITIAWAGIVPELNTDTNFKFSNVDTKNVLAFHLIKLLNKYLKYSDQQPEHLCILLRWCIFTVALPPSI